MNLTARTPKTCIRKEPAHFNFSGDISFEANSLWGNFRDWSHVMLTYCRRKKNAKTDPIYCNRLVNTLVNCISKHGKKSLAYQIIYRAMKKLVNALRRMNMTTTRIRHHPMRSIKQIKKFMIPKYHNSVWPNLHSAYFSFRLLSFSAIWTLHSFSTIDL